MVETPKTVVAVVVEVTEVVAAVVEVVEMMEIIDDDDAVQYGPANVMDAANPSYAAAPSVGRATADNVVDNDDAVDNDDGVDADELDAMVEVDSVIMVKVTESAVSVVVEAAKVAEPLVGLGGDRRDDGRSAQGENAQRDRNRFVEKSAHSGFPPRSFVGRPATRSSRERSGGFKDRSDTAKGQQGQKGP
jgi:hypothetical protein